MPLRFLGRYAHEAVAIDPRTDVIYLTEDASSPNGLFYRWLPPAGFRGGKGALPALAQAPAGDTAGTLQAMRCLQRRAGTSPTCRRPPQPGTAYAVAVGRRARPRWPTSDRVRKQLADDQVTRSRKFEGQWWGDGGAYFVASFARGRRRQRQRARRPGLVLRPGPADRSP